METVEWEQLEPWGLRNDYGLKEGDSGDSKIQSLSYKLLYVCPKVPLRSIAEVIESHFRSYREVLIRLTEALDKESLRKDCKAQCGHSQPRDVEISQSSQHVVEVADRIPTMQTASFQKAATSSENQTLFSMCHLRNRLPVK